MVNSKLLEEKIAESGKIKAFLANKMGLSRQGLYKKINNENEFTASEIIILCDELGISRLTDREKIFFARNVEKK